MNDFQRSSGVCQIWLPTDESTVCYGEVVITDEGINIDYFPFVFKAEVLRDERAVLWALDPCGNKFTLWNYDTNRNGDGTKVGAYGFAECLFAGAHIGSDAINACSRAQINSANFDCFLKEEIVSIRIESDQFQIAAQRRKTICTLPSTGDLRLEVSKESTWHHSFSEKRITEDLFLTVFSETGGSAPTMIVLLTYVDMIAGTLLCQSSPRCGYEIDLIVDEMRAVSDIAIHPPVPSETATTQSRWAHAFAFSELDVDLLKFLEEFLNQQSAFQIPLSIFEQYLNSEDRKLRNATAIHLLCKAIEALASRTGNEKGKLALTLEGLVGPWLLCFGIQATETANYCKDLADTRHWFTHFRPKDGERHALRSHDRSREYCLFA